MEYHLSSSLIRRLIDNTPIAYIILDDQFRIHYINDFFLKLRNLDMETTMGEVCYNISNGGSMCNLCAVAQALKTGEKTMISRKDILPNGTVRFIDDYAIPLYKNEQNGTQYILEIMANRTEEMLAIEQKNEDYNEILFILSALLEAKDVYTATHSNSVNTLSVKLAKAMNLSSEEIFNISVAANLHDLGKVKIANSIINKAGKLTDEEYQAIKSHPVSSYDMLHGLSSFDSVREMVLSHHERYDGKGYPKGLMQDEISLGAKIIAVADTYDAITSTRSYRKALSHEYALEEIARVSGTQLDPQVVDAFVKMKFDNDHDGTDLPNEESSTIERSLNQRIVQSENRVILSDFEKIIDEERMIAEIFNQTPCGYILMDINQKVLYANEYFLNYMEFKKSDIVGRVCYDAGGLGTEPCVNCPVLRSIESGKLERTRQEQTINGSLKIFDMFAIPLFENGEIQFVVEMVIDRTKEVLSLREREKDFEKLIEMLRKLLNEQIIQTEGGKISQEIINLNNRLNDIIEKYKN